MLDVNLDGLKHLFIDVDGVMTDGKTVYNHHHEKIYKQFNDKDFTAIGLLESVGINCYLLTGDKRNKGMAIERNIPIFVTEKWLTVETFNKYDCEKALIIKKITKDNLDSVGYIGDDWFDIPVLQMVPYSFCPSDSPFYVKSVCKYVLNRKGGDGCLSEIAEAFYAVS